MIVVLLISVLSKAKHVYPSLMIVFTGLIQMEAFLLLAYGDGRGVWGATLMLFFSEIISFFLFILWCSNVCCHHTKCVCCRGGGVILAFTSSFCGFVLFLTLPFSAFFGNDVNCVPINWTIGIAIAYTSSVLTTTVAPDPEQEQGTDSGQIPKFLVTCPSDAIPGCMIWAKGPNGENMLVQIPENHRGAFMANLPSAPPTLDVEEGGGVK